MLFGASLWPARFRQRRISIRDEALQLVESYGVDARRVAIRRQLEANTWSTAQYWRRVAAEVTRLSDCGDCVYLDICVPEEAVNCDSARKGRVCAQALARAIEFACADDSDRRAASRPEMERSVEDAALPEPPRRPALRTFLGASTPLRIVSRAGAAEEQGFSREVRR